MDGKMKISFGIKTSKQKTLGKPVSTTQPDTPAVEFISSFDANSKPLGSEKPKEELVIPIKGSKTVQDLVEDSKREKESKSEEKDLAVTGKTTDSLEQLAVKEIIEGVKNSNKSNPDVVAVPLSQALDAKESSLEDYEEIPVEQFGKAMLRGMGWKPGGGIGKNTKIVAPVEPQLRPKGLGLGADKMAVTNPVTYCSTSSADKEGLSLANGATAQVIAGPQNGMYGKIVSHNEDTGRCIVRLEIGGSTVSVNENFLNPVTKEEYSQNARVLNAAKFKRYNEAGGNVKTEKEYARCIQRRSPERKRKEERHSDSRRRRERSRSPIK